MRLIDTRTLQFKEIIGSNIPPYAILSHTWENEEVSYKDYINNQRVSLKGWAKIKQTCALAAARGLGYAWVDTCCIDKSSSAELSEAINSMFDWYQNSAICFAYLSDFDPTMSIEGFSKCRWFTRGWTLQELIAPRRLEFYDSAWRLRCNKSEDLALLSRISGIDEDMLSGTTSLDEKCAAVKMSWAAQRSTTRVEDMAYCLLGIFDINMPLLYGEGFKAFRRLQEEILRRHNDLSVLAWDLPSLSLRVKGSTDSFLMRRSIFATNVRDFLGCDEIFLRGSARYSDLQMNATNHYLQMRASIALQYLTKERRVEIYENGQEDGDCSLGYIMPLESCDLKLNSIIKWPNYYGGLWLHLEKVGRNRFVVGSLGVVWRGQTLPFSSDIDTRTVTISILTDAAPKITERIRDVQNNCSYLRLQSTLEIVDAVPWSEWVAPRKAFISPEDRTHIQVAHIRGKLKGSSGVVDVDVAILIGGLQYQIFNLADYPQVAASLFDAKVMHEAKDVRIILSGIMNQLRNHCFLKDTQGDQLTVREVLSQGPVGPEGEKRVYISLKLNPGQRESPFD